MQCLEEFEEVTKKGLAMKRALLDIGLKHYQKDIHGSSSNDKSKFWS